MQFKLIFKFIQIFEVFEKRISTSLESKANLEELLSALALMAQTSLISKAEVIFNLFDFDNSKLITMDEFVIMIRTVISAIKLMLGLSRCSTNNAEAIANELLYKYDMNKDNKISLHEFQSLVTKDPEIVKTLKYNNFITLDDFRLDFGNNEEKIPEPDSELENEIENDNWLNYSRNNSKQNISIRDQLNYENSPWIPVAKSIIPLNLRIPPETAPDSSLELDHVYGFRAFNMRNNLKYTENMLIYPSGSIMIIIETGPTFLNRKDQRFFQFHTKEIVTFDICKQLVASAQGEDEPAIFIWNCQTLEINAIIKDNSKDKITHLTFTPNGLKLAAIEKNKFHQFISVYDVGRCIDNYGKDFEKNSSFRIASLQIHIEKILDVKWESTQRTLILACNKQLCFATIKGETLKTVICEWEKISPLALPCIASLENSVVTGTFKGHLLIWKNYRNISVINAHKGPVYCIEPRKNNEGVISGGSDGFLKIWNLEFSCLKQISLETTLEGIFSTKLKALCETDDQSIFIGTRSSDIIKIDKNYKCSFEMRGHYFGDLNGLAIHPTKEFFYTVGEDHILSYWDMKNKKNHFNSKIEYAAKCIDCSKDGKLLAIGCLNGHLLIRDAITLALVSDLKDRTSIINVVKFSPHCENLAVAFSTPDCEIIIYSAKGTFKPLVYFTGSIAKTINMDYSQDGNSILVNNAAGELLFFDTQKGKKITNQTELRDARWLTNSSIYGYHCLPIFKNWNIENESKSDNYYPLCSHVSPDKSTFAVGDNYGHINLYRYPAISPNFPPNRYMAGCGAVSNLAFSVKGDYLISLDQNLKTIYQWKYKAHQGSEMKETSMPNLIPKLQIKQKKEIQIKNIMTKPDLDNATPSNFIEKKNLSMLPNCNLKLIHVFAPKVNAIYSSNGTIVYASGNTCITMDKSQKQSFFKLHNHLISSLINHPIENFVASGTVFPGEIKIWNATSHFILSDLKCKDLNVTQLSFSPNGKILLSAWEGITHMIGVWEWKSSILLNQIEVCSNPIFSIVWNDNFEFSSCGISHIKTWQMEGKNLIGKRLMISNSEVPNCVLFHENNLHCGTKNGFIFTWGNYDDKQKIGECEITVLKSYKGTIYCGFNNGEVYSLRVKECRFEKISLIVDLKSISKLSFSIKNICFLDDYILIYNGNEAFEQNSHGELKSLITSHKGRVNDVAFSPNEEFASVGEDKTIMIWNPKTKKLIRKSDQFENELTSIDWSVKGNIMVVGDSKNQISIISIQSLEIIDTAYGSFKQLPSINETPAITVVKIAPNETLLAVGAIHCASGVEIFNISSGKLISNNFLHPQFTIGISYIDWASNCSVLVACSLNNELRFYSLSTMCQATVRTVRDNEFFTWNSPIGFPIYGINNAVTTCKTWSNRFMVSAIDKNFILLTRYPAVENCSVKFYPGHGSKIKKIIISQNDLYVVSIDQDIFVWEADFNIADDDDDKEIENDESKRKEIRNLDHEYKLSLPKKIGIDKYIDSLSDSAILNLNEISQKQDNDRGENLLGKTRPWMSAVREPSGYIKPSLNNECLPMINITIDHIYGYRSKNCKDNVKFLKSGFIAYHVAAIGIVVDDQTLKQSYFQEHRGEISGLDVHPDGVHIATIDFKNPREKFGFTLVKFNKSGSKIATLINDGENTIAIWDSNSGNIHAIGRSGKDYIFDLVFRTDNEFATCGVQCLTFWNIEQRTLMSYQADWELRIGSIFKSSASNNNDYLFGDSTGIITGSNDSTLVVLDKTYIHLTTIILTEVLKESLLHVPSSICVSENESLILIGTSSSQIFSIDCEESRLTGVSKKNKIITISQGPFSPNNQSKNELNGLAVSPDTDQFITSGDDGILRILSLKEKQNVISIQFKNEEDNQTSLSTSNDLPFDCRCTSLCISNDNKLIAAGFRNGNIRIISMETFTILSNFVMGKELISVVKFSPNNKLLAVGCHDFSINIYSVPDFKKKFSLRKHSSFIMHLDWSDNNYYLQSSSISQEINYWDITTGKNIPNGAILLRDVLWHTWTMVYGWPIQHIWDSKYKGDDINIAIRSNLVHFEKYNLLAVGDDYGSIRIFRYPVARKDSEYIELHGHSSFVSDIRWSKNDDKLISIGGEDNSIIIWNIN